MMDKAMTDFKQILKDKLDDTQGRLKFDNKGKVTLEFNLDEYHMLLNGLSLLLEHLRKDTEPNQYWDEVADLFDAFCLTPQPRNWTIKSKELK